MLHKNKKRLDPRYFLHETVNHEDLLIEGMGVEFVKDVVQAVVAGSAEYGLGAVTLPAAGAGLVVGPAVETAVDGLFAAESIMAGLSTITNIGETLGEAKKLIEEASKLRPYLMRGDLDGYYLKVNELVARTIKMTPGSKEDVEKAVERLQEPIKELITRLTDPLVDGIKLAIPDAVIGLAVSGALRLAIVEASEEPFTAAEMALDQSKDLKSFVLEPGVAVKFFEELAQSLIELLLEMRTKLEDASWVKTLATGAMMGGQVVPAAMLKKLGPTGLEKLVENIKEQLPAFLKLMATIVNTIIPLMMAAMAVVQSLLNGDYRATMGAEEGVPAAGTLGPGDAQEAPMFESVRWDLGKNGIFVLEGT